MESQSPKRGLVIALLAVVFTIFGLAGGPASADEFPDLADAPYPAEHVNPRSADFIEASAPTQVVHKWSALTDSTIPQPCISGPEGHVYCMRAWDLASNRCNLIALDGETGSFLWEDRVDGACLLDEYAWTTNVLVDRDGNLYAADRRWIASFTAAGILRWKNPIPGQLTDATGRPNNPFGWSLLPTGELVTATMGNAFVLILDRATGELQASPFDLPSKKTRVPSTVGGAPRPAGFMDGLAGPGYGELVWDVGLGVSDYEVDNNVSVDSQRGLIFITGGAPAPNGANDGALWAVEFDRNRPLNERVSVRFFITFAGPGGIATTPTLTKDGNFALIGDNRSNFVAVDVPACAALPPGSACAHFYSTPVGEKIGASVTVTPENRVFVAVSQGGVFVYDVKRGSNGEVTLEHLYTRSFPGQVVSGVLTGFENAIWLGISGLTGVTVDGVLAPTVLGPSSPSSGPALRSHFLVAFRPSDGAILWAQPSGDFANVSMAADGETLLTNNINFLDELRRDHHAAGVDAWKPLVIP